MNKKYLEDWLLRAAPPDLPPSLRRRTVLRMASALAVSALTAPLAACSTRTHPHFSSDPFTLGVASGCPRSDSIVLWTRLVAGNEAPLPENIELRWEIAQDEHFHDITSRGSVPARSALAHSARVEAGGLKPASRYWYRFM